MFIFTDTSAWFAYLDARDAHHREARHLIKQLTRPLITTTYVLDETLTLVKMTMGHQVAFAFDHHFRQYGKMTVIP